MDFSLNQYRSSFELGAHQALDLSCREPQAGRRLLLSHPLGDHGLHDLKPGELLATHAAYAPCHPIPRLHVQWQKGTFLLWTKGTTLAPHIGRASLRKREVAVSLGVPPSPVQGPRVSRPLPGPRAAARAHRFDGISNCAFSRTPRAPVPPLGDGLAARVEAHRVRAAGVELAEQRAFPTAEGADRHRHQPRALRCVVCQSRSRGWRDRLPGLALYKLGFRLFADVLGRIAHGAKGAHHPPHSVADVSARSRVSWLALPWGFSALALDELVVRLEAIVIAGA